MRALAIKPLRRSLGQDGGWGAQYPYSRDGKGIHMPLSGGVQGEGVLGVSHPEDNG